VKPCCTVAPNGSGCQASLRIGDVVDICIDIFDALFGSPCVANAVLYMGSAQVDGRWPGMAAAISAESDQCPKSSVEFTMECTGVGGCEKLEIEDGPECSDWSEQAFEGRLESCAAADGGVRGHPLKELCVESGF